MNEATAGQATGIGGTGSPRRPAGVAGATEADVALALQLVELAEGELDRLLDQLGQRMTERDTLGAVFDAFVAASGLGHALVTTDGRIEEWSDRAAALTGLAPRPGTSVGRLDHDLAATLVDLVERGGGGGTGWHAAGDVVVACAPVGEPVADRVLVVFGQAGSEARQESTASSTEPKTER